MMRMHYRWCFKNHRSGNHILYPESGEEKEEKGKGKGKIPGMSLS